MSSHQEETLENRLNRLVEIMGQAKETGIDGNMLAQRIEGDLHRLMNSAWLNCADFIHRHERQQKDGMPMATKAAMQYALVADEGLVFLKLWQEGDFDTIRQEWPDAPEIIYVESTLVL